MEVEIRSKEYVKPSSPTPNHLKTHKISLLDQFVPSVYVPMVLYYPIDNESQIQSNEKKLHSLKQSLSQTLTHFYPFAGKIKDSLSIDCNDEGVYYVEAQIDCSLSEFLEQPDVSLIHRLLPCDPSWNESVIGAQVAMVQTSTFNCGGISIGVFVSHMISDGASLSYFLKSWAATHQKGSCYATVDFSTMPNTFHQNASYPKELSMMGMLYPFFKIGKNVTRRFVFDASSIATLKAKTAMNMSMQNPTRVEVVSALIWKCVMAAFKTKNDGIEKPCFISHAADLRRRVEPPFSECLTGNLLCMAIAKYIPKTDTKTELGHLSCDIQKAKKSIYYDILKKMEGDEGGFSIFCEAAKEMSGIFLTSAFSEKGADFIGFSSWNNFGLYEVDFGWGKPMWVTNTGSKNEESSVFLNFVVLLETRWGDGIEAWVTLDEQDMFVLESDQELLEFASLNPSPLKFGMKDL